MVAARLPENEQQRLQRLHSYQILDTPPEAAFDRITRLAASILDVPIALISLIDQDRQWFKSRVGLEAQETPRELAFCAHAILGTDAFVVPDATKDTLFCDNPLVTSGPEIRFYAGALITTRDGLNLGTVCTIDRRARTPTREQLALLRDLGALACDAIELRAAGKVALDEIAERIRIDAFKTAFISTINHELRTPLTSIVGAIELINGGAFGEVAPEIAQLTQIAERNGAVLLRLINDLLDSAKIAEGNLRLDRTTKDIGVLVSETAENIGNYFRDQSVEIRCTAPKGTYADVDAVRIGQVMNNLLSNAVKFSPQGAAVDVAVRPEGGHVEVSVIDRAGGIPEAIRERIFQKFVQAAPAGSTRRPGTGLGLSIAKAIIEEHGGTLGFETELGVGTRFFFRLPTVSGPSIS